MKNLFVSLGIILVVLFSVKAIAYARKTITPSKTMVTVTKDVTAFTDIEISNAIKVIYKQGPNHTVTAKVPENLVDYFRLTQSGNEIELEFYGKNVNIRDRGDILVTVTSPRLKSVDISGASAFTSDEISMVGDEIEFEVSGASSVSLGKLKAGELKIDISGASSFSGNDVVAKTSDIEVSGASSVKLNGATEKMKLEVSGASSASLGKYRATNGKVEVGGVSSASTNIENVISVESSGMSKFKNRK